MRQLNRQLGSDELTDWQAYDMLEPIGPDRIETMLAILCSLFVNANLKKGGKPAKASDFVPDYAKAALRRFVEVVRPSPEQLAFKLRCFNLGLGGKELPRG